MISVQNHRPPLSGNKWLVFLIIALVAAACSPKIRSIPPPPAPVEKPAEKPKPVEKPVEKPKPRISVIALLLPFGLDHLSPGATAYSDVSLKQANLALDYYQGFKLALDSLTALGYNYKLQLFDSKGTTAQAHALAYNPQVRASDLIVGPVFPDDVKAFTSVLVGARKPILSPLAPSEPSLFKNQNLVTAIPPLDCHAWAAAQFINDKIKPRKIFILRSGFSEDNAYIIPFKKALDSLSKKHILVTQVTVVRGQLTSIIPQLSTTNQNVFIVPSTNQAFLTVTLKTLDSLADSYNITLFGHPSWEKFTFLKADLLDHLNTHITSSDRINYNNPPTATFSNKYYKAFHATPSDYSIKGFDEGIYFGRLLGAGNGDIKNLDKTSYAGMHNQFTFTYRNGLGWVNTHVNMLQYINFELKPVE